MVKEIIDDLAENYRNDENVLRRLIDDVTAEALFISHRDKSQADLLKFEIKNCVKSIYLQRGSEDSTSKSESGTNTTYVDAIQKMRNDIIKNGKRIMF